MQAIVRIASSGQNIGSPVRETAFSSPREDISRSQETSTNLRLTKLETVDERAHSERENTQDCERNTKVSQSTTNTSHILKLFREKKTKNTKLKQACEVVFLSMLIVATVSIQAVPTIVYFTHEVSPCMDQLHNIIMQCIVQDVYVYVSSKFYSKYRVGLVNSIETRKK